jgi:hypothetical protein
MRFALRADPFVLFAANPFLPAARPGFNSALRVLA